MKIINKKITPENVTRLSRCEVFVFGSNLAGKHAGGAARVAYEKFGAEWGVGSGPTGRCYAIPTMQGDLESIRPYAEEFIEYANDLLNDEYNVLYKSKKQITREEQQNNKE